MLSFRRPHAQLQAVSAVRMRVVPAADATAFRNIRDAVFSFGKKERTDRAQVWVGSTIEQASIKTGSILAETFAHNETAGF